MKKITFKNEARVVIKRFLENKALIKELTALVKADEALIANIMLNDGERVSDTKNGNLVIAGAIQENGESKVIVYKAIEAIGSIDYAKAFKEANERLAKAGLGEVDPEKHRKANTYRTEIGPATKKQEEDFFGL